MINKIHYHTDCSFFAGCENMLPLFLQSEIIANKFKVSFSYRYSKRYHEELRKNIEINENIYSLYFLNFTDFSLLSKKIPSFIRRVYFFFSRLLFIYPILFYEVFIFILLFKKIKPDVLHINNGGYPGALSCRSASIAGKIMKIPKVIMVVNNMAEDYNTFFRNIHYQNFKTKTYIKKFKTV